MYIYNIIPLDLFAFKVSFCYYLPMKKVRWVFIFVMVAVVVAGIYKLDLKTDAAPEKELKSAPLMVTSVSQKGGLFSNRELTGKLNAGSEFDFRNEIVLAGDGLTAFEFVCGNCFFQCMPGAVVSYRHGIGELHLIKGAFSWKKISGKKATVEVFAGERRDKLIPSAAGNVKLNAADREYRSLEGELVVELPKGRVALKKGEMLTLDRKNNPIKQNVLEGPSQIAPVSLSRDLKKPEDSIVQFNWKSVKGAKEYILRIYVSPLMENVAYEKRLRLNRLGVNLVSLKDNGSYFWKIFPVDAEGVVGNGSETGHIRFRGMLLDRSSTFAKPELTITSLSVSGDVVMIKGAADKNSQLFIDDKEVIVNSDESFFYTLKYTTIGTKVIVFRLVSPAGMETVFERKVVIFEE